MNTQDVLSDLSNVERQERIALHISAHGRASIDELVRLFGVSQATTRRDLEQLAEAGRLERVHGGARSILRDPASAALSERPALEREREQLIEKQQIGRAAALRVADGETVFIGSGTTTLEVARNLRNHAQLTVITNSLLVVNALADAPHIEIIALGGQLRRSEMSLIGTSAEHALADVRADKVIMGIRGIDANAGLTNAYLPETLTDRAILKIAREVILVADHSKFGRIAPAFVAPLSAAHEIISDTGLSSAGAAAISAHGVRIIRAQPN
jgi:DeoR/GlpR family transcriptional regulator of sugar metabolism